MPEPQPRESTQVVVDGSPEHVRRLEAKLVDAWTEASRLAGERNRWTKLFNRLEGAVSHHRNAMADQTQLEHDEALYAAHDRVLKEATKGA